MSLEKIINHFKSSGVIATLTAGLFIGDCVYMVANQLYMGMPQSFFQYIGLVEDVSYGLLAMDAYYAVFFSVIGYNEFKHQ